MKPKYLLHSLLTLPLLPVMYLHGKRIMATVPKLPEAKEPSGIIPGKGRPRKVLVIGESTMAGVGVETHAAGFACALARELSEQLDAEIHWKVYARSGYTLRRLYEKVLPAIEEKSVDLIVLGMGGNEAFKMNTFAGFRRDMQAVIDWLRSRFGSTVPIAFPNMPPIKEFPAFTSVLKFTLGNKVEYFGEELAGLIAGQPQLYYDARVIRLADWREELDLDQDPSAFFSDGVHPSGLTYQLWGREMAKFLLRQPGLRL